MQLPKQTFEIGFFFRVLAHCASCVVKGMRKMHRRVVALLRALERWSVKLQRGSSDEIGVKIGGQLEN